MAGIRALRKIQLGVESTKGTAVPATTIWRGTGVLEDLREVVTPDEDVGYLLPQTDRAYIPKLGAQLTLDPTPATFEQLPYLCAMGIKDTVTGAADGAGTDKIYAYTFPTTSEPTTKSYTFEMGDNQQAMEMEYSFAESISLTGAIDEAWQMGAVLKGRQATNASFTGELSIPTVEEILFNKTKLYIDAAGSIGSTQKTSLLLGADLSINTGIKGQQTGDGNLYFTFSKMRRPEIELTLTFEHQSDAQTEITAWRNKTVRAVKLLVEGAAAATAGTTYTYKSLIIELYGVYTGFSGLDDDDGDDTVTGTLRAGYDGTGTSAGGITVVNELASLT